MASHEDLTGRVFGRWSVIDYRGPNKRKSLTWLCRCGCGTERVVDGFLLRSGRSLSCGCGRARATQPLASRFFLKVDKSDNCWIWRGCRDGHGYGQILGDNKRPIGAHRASWMIHRGSIPAAMHVCHRCDNPACVNPDHLFLGTNADNMADKAAKGRAPSVSHPGESHPRAKLKTGDVVEVRRLVAGGASQASVARRFGIGATTVFSIVHGIRWRSV